MPRAFVTGSNGFVGVNLVAELTIAGWDVTAMHRSTSDITYLQRLPAQRVIADVGDLDALAEAMPSGVDVVFHVAGDTSYWARNDERQTATNVDGTRNVVEIARRKGVGRFVYTSSISAYGLVSGPIDSDTPSRALSSGINYDLSKWLGEEEVRRGIERGLDAVIIRPGSILGRYDRHNWIRLIELVAVEQLPGVADVVLNFCHGAAVARAHITAADRGASGQAYLLGGTAASMMEAVQLIAELTGGRAPTRTTPMWALAAYARFADVASRITGREPDLTPQLVRQMRYEAIADVTKAVDELDFEVVPLHDMVSEAVEWMRSERLLGRI